MQNLVSRLGSLLSDWKVPRDGTRRYIYDIWQPLTLLVIVTSFAAAFFYNYDSSIYPYDDFFCNADGNLEKLDYDYEPMWDLQLYFTINIAFGRFPFSRAKVIDAAWDAVIGRGGQFVAAAIAYRILRRSFTLTMEICTVTIPAAASLYCRQIQPGFTRQLLHTMFWHWGSVHLIWRQPIHMGRMRLCTQLFVCIYVLLFAILVSVMTGYRAQLSGFTGYDSDEVGPLFPVSLLVEPRMSFYDSARVGLPDAPMFAHDAIIYPDGVGENIASADIKSMRYNISELLASSRGFKEPWGVLVDYYYTCLAVQSWVLNEMAKISDSGDPTSNTTARSLECASHNCSCSAPVLPSSGKSFFEYSISRSTIFNSTASTITIGGRFWDLPAPLLSVGLKAQIISDKNQTPSHPEDASDFWSGSHARVNTVISTMDSRPYDGDKVLLYNDIPLVDSTIISNGRCIAEDAYSWGYSSLLLLTFCCYTIAFALALILLQTDVYWNSRHDRDHQSHSLYTDVLCLAEELKNTFGQDIEDHMKSPKAFDKKVENWKQGLHLDVRELPPSRWQEWRQSRAKKRADRKAKVASTKTNHSPFELRNMSSRNHGRSEVIDTAYHGLIGGDGGESSFKGVHRPDHRSTSGELAPSLAGMQTSTGGSVHDGTLLGDPAVESSLLEGVVSGGASPAGSVSRDQLRRTDREF